LKGQMPKKGKTDGTVEDFAGRTWVWQQEVQPLQVKGMWRIDVNVRPLREGESKSDAASKKASWYSTLSGVMGDAVESVIYMATDYDVCTGGDQQTGGEQNPALACSGAPGTGGKGGPTGKPAPEGQEQTQ